MNKLITLIPFLIFTNFDYVNLSNKNIPEVFNPVSKKTNLLMDANETRRLLNELKYNKELLNQLENEGNTNSFIGT